MKSKTMKTCKSCGKPFQPFQSMQQVCSPTCAYELVKARNASEIRKKARGGRRAYNRNRPSWQLEQTQKACNALVRERDKGKPCVSCGKPDGAGVRHAGHYRAAGSTPELRFELDNIHGQCYSCNVSKSGDLTAYRIGLIERIGLERVEWLEGPHHIKRWFCDDLEKLRAEFRKQLKELKGE